MRAIYFFLINILFFLSACATVEVAKEVTKASQSIGASVRSVLENPEAEEVDEFQQQKDTEKRMKIENIKKQIIKEKAIIKKTVVKQKAVTKLNILGESIPELSKILGKPSLVRSDGSTITVRFDSDNCRLFVFSDSELNKNKIIYFELRKSDGKIIKLEKEIEDCYKEIIPI